MGARKSKKNNRLTYNQYKHNKEYFDFLRLTDKLIMVQDEIRIIRNYRSDAYNYGYNITHNDLDNLEERMEDVLEELTDQMDNQISIADFKAILRGIKHTIINQLSNENSRKWRQWEESASYKSTSQHTLSGMFEEFGFEYVNGNWLRDREDINQYHSRNNTTKKTTPKATAKALNQYTNRPTKKLKWTLKMTEDVSIFIQKMMLLYPKIEWGCAFSYVSDKEDKALTIDRIYLMPIKVGSSHVTFINESEYNIFADISELPQFVTDIMKEDRYAGMMHSHHNMGAWHSATDHGTIDTYVTDFKTILSIVWANKSNKLENDIILDYKGNRYTVNKFEFYNDQEVTLDTPSELTDRYKVMLDLVTKDYNSYDKLIKTFGKNQKFLKIRELFTEMNNDDTKQVDIQLIKDLI